MADQPLMPIATAVWLIDNTSLTFEQIATFCGLHELQVKGIADGDVAVGVRGIDPITSNQLTREEIDKAQDDASYRMALSRPKTIVAERGKKAPRYTPVSKRQNRPDAIAWIVRNHPEVTDAQISRLLGTTKSTIQSVRDRTHWNSANITPQDPVGLGLCSQIDLDAAVKKAAAKAAKLAPADSSPTLTPTEDTVTPEPTPTLSPDFATPPPADTNKEQAPIDADSVFANFGTSEQEKE
ncbi:MAG: cell cycle transcriptional regulator TrcR [Pseudomonadota bacterium]